MGVARSIARRVRNRIVGPPPAPAPPPPKTWARSQQYEFSAAQLFMESDWFKNSIAAFASGRSDASTGHVDELPFREFFNEDRSLWDSFKVSVQGKTGVDIGPCVWSPMANWSFLSRRIAIEPLGEKVRQLQLDRYGCSFFDNMELRSVGADAFMPDLESAIDGVVYCRNMIDHTPSWPVVMANLGLYAARGCHLLLWADYNHEGMADEGHYEICETQDDFKRIVRSLGFDVLREFEDKDRLERNWGCVAVKR